MDCGAFLHEVTSSRDSIHRLVHRNTFFILLLFFIFYSLIIYLRITIPIIREQLLFLDFCRKIANILREPICFKEHFFCLYGNTLSEFCYLESLFVYYELCVVYQ